MEGDLLEITSKEIESFSLAVTTTLMEMAGVEAIPGKIERAVGADGFADVSVCLRFISGIEGWMALSFPAQVAAELAGRVLKEVGGAEDESMVRDCIAELVNVIAGNAKTRLFGTISHFYFSTPTTITRLDEMGQERWLTKFDSEVGGFSLHLCIVSRQG